MKKNTEINGVLYLPALGLLLSCVTGTINNYQIIRMFLMKIREGQQVEYWFAAYISLAGIIYMLWTYYSTVQFYSQKKSAIKAMIVYYALGFLLYVPLFAALHIFYHIPVTPKMLSAIIAGFIGIIVWMPYFMKSKRVQIVFYK